MKGADSRFPLNGDAPMIYVVVGDLITGMQKFVTMIGWKDEMVELITKEEGEFKIVSTLNVLNFLTPKILL